MSSILDKESYVKQKSAIPALETLKSIPQWVCHKEKLPKNPHTGGNGSSTNPQTWGTFMEAVRANKRYSMDGLGWVFTKESGIIGIDLDSCIDEGGRIQKWAEKIVLSVNSYTEISPSGRGLHIFAYADIPKSLGPTPSGRLEMYNQGRYFTVTGRMLQGSFPKIAHRQEEITRIWQAEHKFRRETNHLSKSAPNPPKDLPLLSTEKLKAYTEKAYLDEIATLSMATEGCRNDQLNRTAFNLGQFIQAGLLNQTEVETTLLSIGCQLGLLEREAWATIQSGIKGGVSNPRTNWPDFDKEQATPGGDSILIPDLPQNDLFYHDKIKPYLDYVSKRWGLNQSTVDLFKIGYCEACPTSPYSASFTFPYYSNDNDNLVDIRHRLLSPNGHGPYRPEVEGYPSHLFNVKAAHEDDYVILVNREISTMLLYGGYYLPAVGLPSTFKKEWLNEFDGLKKVFIALDPGQEIAARKIGTVLATKGIEARLCTLPFSPKDMLVKYGCSLREFIRFIDQGWRV